jgi:hypothetical protein
MVKNKYLNTELPQCKCVEFFMTFSSAKHPQLSKTGQPELNLTKIKVNSFLSISSLFSSPTLGFYHKTFYCVTSRQWKNKLVRFGTLQP